MVGGIIAKKEVYLTMLARLKNVTKVGKRMREELKPCPFCGGKASLNYEHIPGEDKGFWAQVICNACHGRSGGTWAGSYNAAERKEVKAWNRRANDETD